MKCNIKRVLALMMALILTVPNFTFAEENANGTEAFEKEAVEIDQFVAETDESLIADTGDDELAEAEESLIADAWDDEMAEAEESLIVDVWDDELAEVEESLTVNSWDYEMEESSDGEPGENTAEEEPGETETEAEPGETEPGETEPEADPVDEESGEDTTVGEAFAQTCTANGVAVTVRAGAGAFPEGTKLSVKRVPTHKAQQADEAIEDIRDEEQNVAVSYTFDIKVIDPETGEEIQPAEGFGVEVSFALAETADENLTASVYHIEQDGSTGELTAEKLDTDVDADSETVTASTDSFSYYTVEFTYNDLQYVLQGDESVPLREILEYVGLTGEAGEVEVSCPELFSVSNESGEWIVTAHQAFNTTEWMKVTIGGVEFEITVTDDILSLEYYDPTSPDGTGSVASADYNVLDGKGFLEGFGQYHDHQWMEELPDSSGIPFPWYSWYVATEEEYVIEKRVEVDGDINLILCNGATLICKKGIHIPTGSSLTIWSSDKNYTGKLIVEDSDGKNAGIGGGENETPTAITINGGIIEVEEASAAGIGGGLHGTFGTITINDGTVTANSSIAAGIGAGVGGDGGTIIIRGGTVTAKGGWDSAGIGGSYKDGGNITISGGTIEAYGGRAGAGIGGGEASAGGRITISGANTKVKAIGGGYDTGYSGGAGIGGGGSRYFSENNIVGGSGGTIIISDATVEARGGQDAAGIGGGWFGSSGSVTINSGDVTALGGIYGAGIGGGRCGDVDRITISGGKVTADGDNGSAGIGGGADSSSRIGGGGGEIDISGGEIRSNMNSDSPGIGGGRGNDTTKINLSYRDESLADMSVTAHSYNGEVTILKGKYFTDNKVTYTGTLSVKVKEAIKDKPIRPGSNVVYLNEEGSTSSPITCIPVGTDTTTWTGSGSSGGWYVAVNAAEISELIEVSGDVHLVLCDEAELKALSGIRVSEGSSLTIYAQSTGEDAGKLIATGGDGQAGIGSGTGQNGGSITIDGGTITATGGSRAAGIGGGNGGSGGSITINGGKVEDVQGGSFAAGIGGGFKGDSGTITITGGTIEDIKGDYGAGIGGGYEGGASIKIEGGTITNVTGDHSAGIGGGKAVSIDITNSSVEDVQGETGIGCSSSVSYEPIGTITIKDSTIKATGISGAGIGGSKKSNPGTITIENSTIEAASGSGAGIGGGEGGVPGEITIKDSVIKATGSEGIGGSGSVSDNTVTLIYSYSGEAHPMSINASSYGSGTVIAKNTVLFDGDNCYSGTFTKDEKSLAAGKELKPVEGLVMSYVDWNGNRKDPVEVKALAVDTELLNAGWYTANANITIEKRITINGEVNLIVKNSTTMILKKGFEVAPGSQLTIWAQTTGSSMGRLFIGMTSAEKNLCDDGCAGIGGSSRGCGNIVINGGDIKAAGGKKAAGIGAGSGGSGGTITFNGGETYAYGGENGAGIGGYGTIISITGGTVKGYGGKNGAGIGGDDRGKSERITISGCRTSVGEGGENGAGIGGGNGFDAGIVKIFGDGTVTGNGGKNGAGIGGGKGGPGGDITISGCSVTTRGGGQISGSSTNAGGAGIGGGSNAPGGSITITGGWITARSSIYGAGIGGGYKGSGGTIVISGGSIDAIGVQSGYVRGRGIGAGTDAEQDNGTTTISYRPENKIGMYVYATDYSGKVELRQPFKERGTDEPFDVGVVTDLAAVNGRTIVPADERKLSIEPTENGTVSTYPGGYAYADQVVTVSLKPYASSEVERVTVTAQSGTAIELTAEAENTWTFTMPDENVLISAAFSPVPVMYLDEKGAEKSCRAYSTITENTSELNDGWYVVGTNVGLKSRLIVRGSACLILMDGTQLSGSIDVSEGNTLVIYAQSKVGDDYYSSGCGKLTVVGDYGDAGIGGGDGKNGGTIIINGGYIYASTKSDNLGEYNSGAGIGGGHGGNGGTIIINEGYVKVNFNNKAAGIGGGYGKSGGSITINGGEVEVRPESSSFSYGAGIGGGEAGAGGEITINDGKISAEGGRYGGAGIGGGEGGAGGEITISGGSIEAKGTDGAGIGGGNGGAGGKITISGGNIQAKGTNGAGIGGGNGGAGGEITISGGDIQAEGFGGADIGGGDTSGDPVSADTTITLDYTVETQKTMQIKSVWEGFSGTVTLKKPFEYYTKYSSAKHLAAGEVEDLSILKQTTIRPDSSVHGIHIEAGHGTVTADPSDIAAEGTLITLTVVPEPLCTLTGMRGYAYQYDGDYSGDHVSVIQLKKDDADDNIWTFIMPNEDIMIMADFEQQAVPYIDHAKPGGSQEASCESYTLLAGQVDKTELTTGWYVIYGIEGAAFDDRICVDGDVNLILCDGSSLSAAKGIEVPVGSRLTIYAQSAGTGRLEITGAGDGAAGIGGGLGNGCGSITVKGGIITARGGVGGAGIGGGIGGAGNEDSVITLVDGTVTAIAGTDAQAVGTGKGGRSCRVDITGIKAYANAESTDPVPASERMDICRSGWAKLMRCGHKYDENDYFLDAGSHWQECEWCTNRAYEENHTFDEDDKCVCGYINQKVSFPDAKDGGITVTYGDTLTLAAQTNIAGQTITYTSSNSSVAAVDTEGNLTIYKAGTVDITSIAGAGENWSESSATCTVTIQKRPLTVTANAQTKTCGDADPELTYNIEGLAEGDTLDELSGFLTRDAGEKPGTYAIRQGTLESGSGNYVVSYTGADLTILEREEENADMDVLGKMDEKDVANSSFCLLQLKVKKVTGSSIKIAWNKVPGATTYTIYGNKCGRKNRYEMITTVTGTSYTHKKLKKGTYYKYVIVAKGPGNLRVVSKTLHVATTGGKVGNNKSVRITSKKKVVLKKGKTSKIKAKTVRPGKKLKVETHRKLAYETSNPKVATVNKKGKIKAVGAGTCTIYVYAQNGVYAKVKVKVKN